MRRLNIACGANIFPDWVNIDIVDMEKAYICHLRTAPHVSGWPEDQVRLYDYLKNPDSPPLDLRVHDVRKPLPFSAMSVDAIYLGQMIEHLNPIHEVPKFLEECWRVLKAGARVRITTPDLKQLLLAYRTNSMDMFAWEQPAWYAEGTRADKLAYMMFGAGGPDCTRDNYEGHFHCFTQESLKHVAERCGFRWCGEEKSEAFSDVIDKGLSHSMAVEIEKI